MTQIVAHDLIHNEILPKEHFVFNFFHLKKNTGWFLVFCRSVYIEKIEKSIM
jgi:hypothetical protein